MIPAFFIDMQHSFANIPSTLSAFGAPAALISLLYAGILSSGAGYTLQVVGQKGINPTIASLLMSLESVFSVLGGWIILHERMNGRELFGCALIFAAVILAQIPLEAFRRKSSTQ